MAKFCRNCGSPVMQDEKFCRNCGFALPSTGSQMPAQQKAGMDTRPARDETAGQIHEPGRKSPQIDSAAKFCRYCGNVVAEGARFCRRCGRSLVTAEPHQEIKRQANPSVPQQTNRTWQSPQGATSPLQNRQAINRGPQRTTVQQPIQAAPRMAGPGNQAPRMQPAVMPWEKTLTATASVGEFDFGDLEIPGLADVGGVVTKVFAPVSGIFHGIGSFFSGIFRIFRKPSALIGTVLLAALWFVLARFRGSDSQIVKILSWLTFSEGGFDRSALGAVGGMLGKGTVAASLVSLFSGGLKNAVSGIGKLFNGSGEKRGIVSILLGVVIGGLAYLVFVGPENASGATAMAGISGALLSLEALGGGSGKIWELAQSLTSRAANGVRTAVRGKCDGLLTGLTIGFALATALSAFL